MIDQGYLEVELKETLGKDVDLIFIGSSMDVCFQKQLEQGKIRIR